MYTFLSVITPKTNMQSRPALNQPLPSGKITAICTDITTMLKLPLAPKTPDCILGSTWTSFSMDSTGDKQDKGGKSGTSGNQNLDPTTHHPPKRAAMGHFFLLAAEFGQGG